MQDRRPGKVTKSTRNQYQVFSENRNYTCVVRGKIVGSKNRETVSVKVGDDVIIERISNDEGIIIEILPRKSKLSRAVEGKAYQEHIIVTNIDQMIIITSTRMPDFKTGLLDRYLVIAEKNQLSILISGKPFWTPQTILFSKKARKKRESQRSPKRRVLMIRSFIIILKTRTTSSSVCSICS